MMRYFGNGYGYVGGGTVLLACLALIFFIAAVVLAVILAVGAARRRGPGDSSGFRPSVDRSLEILRERYAKGEINEEQYNRMKDELFKR